MSRVSWPLPLAGGHGDGSARPFITVTLGEGDMRDRARRRVRGGRWDGWGGVKVR